MTSPNTPADLPEWAPVQPFDSSGVPELSMFPSYGGVTVVDIGEDGDMIIVGHLGVLAALTAFTTNRRQHIGDREAREEFGDVNQARGRVQHMWATAAQRCATYPMCRPLGPTGDGHPCHSVDDEAFDEHKWGPRYGRPRQMEPVVKPHQVTRWRQCDRCDLREVTRVDGTVELHDSPCSTCTEIDDAGGFYIEWQPEPTDGAFPITRWPGW